MTDVDSVSIPDYLRDVYHWAYVSERSAHWLDRNWVVRLLLFGNDKRLMCAFLDRIQPGAKIWLVANVYPRGLRGEQISLGARLFAVIDTLDAITSGRPYRKAKSFEQARDEIVRMSGTQFDPLAVQAFLAEEKTLREMVDAKCMLPNDLAIPQTQMRGVDHDTQH